MKLFDSTFAAAQRSMDLQLRRYSLLASNVANSETPNYRARDFDFAGELQRATGAKDGELRLTNPLHMDTGSLHSPHIIHDDSGETGADGNNVDLDLEVGKISEASRAYGSAANFVAYKLRMIRQAISGRGA